MRKSGSLVGLVFFSAVLVACSLQKYNIFEYAAAKYENPHTNCTHCHGVQNPKGEQALFPPASDPSLYCLDCHVYAQNHHPVNFVPLTSLKPQFRLYNGKLTCLTCHEIHGGPDHAGMPKLLRGGPYADRRTICFDCHAREKFAEIYPHRMLDKNGAIRLVNNRPVCLVCHEVQPDPAVDRDSNVHFRADIGFLCWRCHPPMPGSFDHEHYLVKPDKQTLEYMSRPEVQEEFILPLAPGGRISCSTCHNPHQAGVIQYKPAAAGAGAPQRLRSTEICKACHVY